MQAPLIPDPPPPARNVMSPATSVVSTNRLAGCSAAMLAMTSSRLIPRRRMWSEIWFSAIGVRIQPGATALAVSPAAAPSRAATFTSPSTACLAATYAALYGAPCRPRVDEGTVIRPPGWRGRWRHAKLDAREGPLALGVDRPAPLGLGEP